MVFGGIWKECYKSGSSIRLRGGIRACLASLQLVFPPHSHASRQKTQSGFQSWVPYRLSIRERHPCRWNVIYAWKRSANFKGWPSSPSQTFQEGQLMGCFRKSLCIPTILKMYDFCGTKIQLATMVSIIACPALWECFLSVAAFLLLLSLLFSPPAPETAAWLTHHRPRH